MTWFKMDDTAPDHAKFLQISQDADLLWVKAGAMCGRENTDGVINPGLVPHYGALAKIPSAEEVASAVKELVSIGLWHDARSIKKCGRCMEATDDQGVKRGWYFFHDWVDYQPSKAGKRDPIERKKDRRKRQLHRTEKGMEVKGRVRERDRDLCRYCGVLTHWTSDHTSPKAGTIDHIDPLDFTSNGTGNSTGNCVVACRKCNGRKRDRTPEQAKMKLLPEPVRTGSGSAPGASTEPIRSRNRAETEPAQTRSEAGTPSRDARDGPDQVGIGSRSQYGADTYRLDDHLGYARRTTGGGLDG